MNGVLNDQEFEALKAEERRCWAEVEKAKESIRPVEEKWIELYRRIQREELKRELFAQQPDQQAKA